MSPPTYIAGDWGTTHLRLFLCSAARVLERREGPGVAAVSATAQKFAEVLHELCDPWMQAHGELPVRLAGMVGSRNGWREAPYAPCPADASSVAASMLRITAGEHDIAIAPGLSCVNPRGAPDVLRGEETQIFGAFAQHPDLTRGRHILVLPGTHSKWALVENGRILQFQTSVSGELYALLRAHSTLARASSPADRDVDVGADAGAGRRAFAQGLHRACDPLAGPLHHLLFETRSRQLVGDLTHANAMWFLSGLIIGQEVAGALQLFDGSPARGDRVVMIGAPRLTALYQLALIEHSIDALRIDAAHATVSGLQVYASLA